MNVSEGARRMRFAGQRLVLFALTALGTMVVFMLLLALLPSGHFSGIAVFEFVPLCLPIAALGALLWLAGWIVEGFGKKEP
jgi:hypothetical protein